MTAEEMQSRSIRREVNERIAELIAGFHDSASGDPTMIVFCECEAEECMAPIEMTIAEFQAARVGPARWVMSSAHIDMTKDSVIARRNGYALIERASDRPSGKALPRRKEPTSLQTKSFSEP